MSIFQYHNNEEVGSFQIAFQIYPSIQITKGFWWNTDPRFPGLGYGTILHFQQASQKYWYSCFNDYILSTKDRKDSKPFVYINDVDMLT